MYSIGDIPVYNKKQVPLEALVTRLSWEHAKFSTFLTKKGVHVLQL